jgi:DNA invertase Pin-like site-specific DNA recombinase
MDVETGTKISARLARREAMLEPDEVTAMLRLKKLGWGTRRIALELGCSRTTVQRYIGWLARVSTSPQRNAALEA